MALDPSQTRLPCGVQLDALLEQITEGAAPGDPAHQAHCPYCQTALRGFRQGWTDLQTVASGHLPIPAGLTSRIMTQIRALAPRAAENILLACARGHTQISHEVIARIARRVALATPGVIFASARPEPGDVVDPIRVKLTLRLITTYGPALHPLAAAVRRTVIRRLPRLTGAEIDTINIAITDIAEPDR
jgi:uncharacterized alkaline shock family protein YloU